MSEFQVSTGAPKAPVIVDKRTLVERMFFDFDQTTGKNVSLNVVPMAPGEDWKRVQDCIPLMRAFKKDDTDYEGPLKGKDVLVFGGRRRGRAGTGVEFLLPVDAVDEFCGYLQQVAKAVRA